MNKKKELWKMAFEIMKECENHPTCEGCAFDNNCVFSDFNGNETDELVARVELELEKITATELDAFRHLLKDGCIKILDNDNVNHPKHYETGKFECIDVMIETQGVEAVQNFCICNAFKYVYRHKYKNGAEDIRKAIWYLNKFVELECDNRVEHHIACVPARGDRLKGD